MATFNLRLGSTRSSTAANSIASLPDVRKQAYMVEEILDISKIANYTCTNGDVFEVLEIPAGTFVVAAGAEVLTAFNGTTPTVDIDFAAGDDIVDGQSVTSTGYLAAGSNTIDVKLICSAANVTSGILRVYAIVVDVDGVADGADEVDRDQLA